jgi:hypothetical protein
VGGDWFSENVMLAKRASGTRRREKGGTVSGILLGLHDR